MTTLLIIELIALVIGVTAELLGVKRHEEGKIDTYSEFVWWVRRKLGRWYIAVAVPVSALMLWAIPHLWL